MQKKSRNKSGNGTANNRSKVVQSKDKSNTNNGKFSNDPSWYAVDPSIMRDAASIPFSLPAGDVLPFSQGNLNPKSYIPGVMSMYLAPTIGYAKEPTDPINIAATQSYAFIRHANSGSANYDAPDIMLYYLAMADVYSFIEYLKRMYGVVQVYAQRNKYLPRTLLASMKVSPSSLTYHMADFRLGLNMLINKAASFAVPNTMSIFARRQFLYAGVYTEGSSIRDQLYLYNPVGFSVYDWKNSQLKFMPLNAEHIKECLGLDVETQDGLFDALDLIQIGHAMVDLIINNEDMGIMNGDILKAYGDSILKLSHLDENYAIAPVYDPYVLEQMQNATILTGSHDGLSEQLTITSQYMTEEGGVTFGTPVLVSTPQFAVSNPSVTKANYTDTLETSNMVMRLQNQGLTQPQLLSTMLPEPEAKDNMELTRLMAVLGPNGELYSGSEVCVACKIFTKPWNGDQDACISTMKQRLLDVTFESSNWEVTFPLQGEFEYSDIIHYNVARTHAGNQNLEVFKFRPHVYVYDTPDRFFCWIYGDDTNHPFDPKFVQAHTSNYTVLQPSNIINMHRAALINEFATPHVAIKSV